MIRQRLDKTPEEASSPDVIVDLYNRQQRKVTSAADTLSARKAGAAKPAAAVEDDDINPAVSSDIDIDDATAAREILD